MGTATLSSTANYRLYNTNTLAGSAITNGTCSSIYCHSSGRALGAPQYTTTNQWGTAGPAGRCLACHGGRDVSGNYVASTAGFKLSTTHGQHMGKYPAVNMNCQICHSKTAASNVALKPYTGVILHANAKRNVTFTGIPYGTYSSYKSVDTGSGGTTRTCENVSCHGGKTRASWTNTTVNSNNTCTHCHGVPTGVSTALVVTGANRYNLRFFAPGWNKQGTDTDQSISRGAVKTGAHFKHLSSAYMAKIKCNECHAVPSNPFDNGHINASRYNSTTLSFAQSSTAKILIGVIAGSTPAQLVSFTGYTASLNNSKAATCSSVYCHGNRLKNGEAGGTYRKPYWNYSGMVNYANPVTACNRCHGVPPSVVPGSHVGATLTSAGGPNPCSKCHGAVVDSNGNIINKALHINGIANATGCTSCHGNPPVDSTVGTSTGLASTVTGATSPGAHDAHTNVTTGMSMTCNACHNNSIMGTSDNKMHMQFSIKKANYPYFVAGTTAPFGTFSGAALPGPYTGYSTGATKFGQRADALYTCNTYCHAAWNNNGGARSNPRWTTPADGACGGCHYKDAATVQATGAPGSHSKHATSNGTAGYNYAFKCTFCHSTVPNTKQHVQGFAQVSFNTLSSAGRINAGATYNGSPANPGPVNSIGLGGIAGNYRSCGNLDCHSSGRAAGMGIRQYNTPTWGQTPVTPCLFCHGGRDAALGNPARSTSGFGLSTTHYQHFKYGANNINCNICHSQTVTDAATLKPYSGVSRHVNGKRDVTFSATLYYGTYTSFKSTDAGSGSNVKTCNNISCHGGRTRSSWVNNAINANNTCVHCHGVATTATTVPNSGDNRKFFAPGWNKTGTDTDQSTSRTATKAGAHFKHLSSAYMKKIKCNECHLVPSDPFDVGHFDNKRYNSATINFSQASSAKIVGGATPTQLATFTGYTGSLNNSKAATCSSVYCHGNRTKNGYTGATYPKPYWNYSGMVNYTDPANACSRCHGYPPTGGHTTTTDCSTCHNNVIAGNKSFKNKALHINGIVEGPTGCNACHNYDLAFGAWSSSGNYGGYKQAVGAHAKHITYLKTRFGVTLNPVTDYTVGFGLGNAAKICGVCHSNNLADHTPGTPANLRALIFGSYTAHHLTSTGLPTYDGASNVNGGIQAKTCSNLDCHYKTTPLWY